MSAAAVFALVTVIYQSDIIVKDTIHGVKVLRHAAKHPKKTLAHPVQTIKEVR